MLLLRKNYDKACFSKLFSRSRALLVFKSHQIRGRAPVEFVHEAELEFVAVALGAFASDPCIEICRFDKPPGLFKSPSLIRIWHN